MGRFRKKYLPLLCAAAGGALLAGTVWACVGLTRGTGGDRLIVGLSLLALAGLAAVLLWVETRDVSRMLVMLLPVGAALFVRALCLDYVSLDYQKFLSRWYVYFRTNGGVSALADSVGDYNVPYLYFMAAISYLDVPDLYLIKLFSIFWDVLLAWGCFRLVRSLVRERQGSVAPLTAFAAALLLPTVVLNGALWGQCDVIYGALAIHAAALALEGRNKTSVALMAVAFSFKLQAVFVLPLWGVLWLAKKVKFWELWVFPVTYLATVLPAVFLGKPLADTLGIYFNQMTEVPDLVLNAASIYQFIPRGLNAGGAEGKLTAALSIAAAMLALILLGVGFCLRDRLDRNVIRIAAGVLCVGGLFFLLHMMVSTLGMAVAMPKVAPVKVASTLGIAAAGALVLALLALGFRLRERLDRELTMTMAVILCVGVPFFLPHMHERYFFLADVFTLCWACANVKRLPAAVLAAGASLASYMVYLRLKYNFVLTLGGCTFVMPLESLAMLSALIFSVLTLHWQLRLRKTQEGLA